MTRGVTRRTALRLGGRAALGAIAASTAGSACGLTGRQAAVLGCGVVGLATARLLQLRGWTVTIYARDLPPRTTSNVAGGQWTPASVFDPDEATPAFRTQFVEASRIAFRYFQDFVGAGYGVRWIDNYYLSDEPRESRLFERGNRSLDVDAEAERRIVEGHRRLFGSMRTR